MKSNKKQQFLYLLIIQISICFLNISVKAQLTEKYSSYEEHFYKGMKYGLFKPLHYDKSKSYPLVMILNGFDDTIPHDFVYYKESFQLENPCFVISPICYGNPYLPDGGWTDIYNDTLKTDGKKAVEILDLTMRTYRIDTSRLYIRGASMGGFGTFAILSNLPGKFAAAYVICGGGKMDIATKLVNTPLWIFHGQTDDVVPIHLSRNIYNEILKLGGKKVRFTEYPCVKHNSWENAEKEKTLETWLFRQEKGKSHGRPDKIEGFSIEATKEDNIVKWDLPKDTSNPDAVIWYYKIYRNDVIIAEVDGDINTYVDNVRLDHDKYLYRLIAVNYYFKESEPSETIKIK